MTAALPNRRLVRFLTLVIRPPKRAPNGRARSKLVVSGFRRCGRGLG